MPSLAHDYHSIFTFSMVYIQRVLVRNRIINIKLVEMSWFQKKKMDFLDMDEAELRCYVTDEYRVINIFVDSLFKVTTNLNYILHSNLAVYLRF